MASRCQLGAAVGEGRRLFALGFRLCEGIIKRPPVRQFGSLATRLLRRGQIALVVRAGRVSLCLCGLIQPTQSRSKDAFDSLPETVWYLRRVQYRLAAGFYPAFLLVFASALESVLDGAHDLHGDKVDTAFTRAFGAEECRR
jgi:hypothetical protein